MHTKKTILLCTLYYFKSLFVCLTGPLSPALKGRVIDCFQSNAFVYRQIYKGRYSKSHTYKFQHLAYLLRKQQKSATMFRIRKWTMTITKN